MKMQFQFHARCFATLAFILWAVPAFAQVPWHFPFTGRLVDDLGDPLVGPVSLELRVFDDESAGTEIYAEVHSGTPLDVTGAFAVQLGLGTTLRTTLPFGSEPADIFADVSRWLEVVVDSEVLTPRQIIGSVPWALIAQQANEIVPDPNAPRFEDCADGTVADHQTGLQWEKKTGTLGTGVDCDTVPCPDPHDVNNRYPWSGAAPFEDPDGVAFADFVARLNAKFDPPNPTACFADRCDWRLAEISELQTILIGPDAAPGQATTCSIGPCIDPDFAAIGGPTASNYWSASTLAGAPNNAWYALFDAGFVFNFNKPGRLYVRAVRAGSCN